jgi:hypothetical protein
MTEEYKKQLIDYTTGLLNQENPDPKDFNLLDLDFKQYKDSFSEFFEELSLNAIRLRITGILENENYDISILYGGYISTDQSASLRGRGFLIYLDKDNNVLDVLFKDKNNNYLRGFHNLYFDEETNRVYGVLGHPTASLQAMNEDNYLCYISNLFIQRNGKYEVDINKSYALEENDIYIYKIVKHPEYSYYLMVGEPFGDVGAKVIEYKVVVGSSNEMKKWELLEYQGHYGSYWWVNVYVLSYYLWYVGETPHFKVVFGGLNYNTDEITYNGKYYGLAVDNGDNVSYTRLNEIQDIIQPQQSTNWEYTQYKPEVLAINENEMYFITIYTQYIEDNNYFQTRIQKYNGSIVETLYSSPITSPETEYINQHDCYYFNFYEDTDGTIYLVKYFTDYSASLVYTSLLNFTKYYNDIGGNNWLDLDPLEYDGEEKIYSTFTIFQRSYNICKIFNIVGDISGLIFYQPNLTGYILTITNLFNLDGYNGTPYIDTNFFVPKLSNLYSNNKIVFSRNLYNISIQDNTTSSSVEVPNNYLNDLTIDQSNLVGATNYTLVNDTNSWSKNVYEVVDISFINTINVIDEDTDTLYLHSAIKLNENITNGGLLRYNNTKCIKYRINYADNTSSIGDLNWQPINDTNKKVKFTIYVDKAINNIDLISNDETTIYLTINGTFTIGNYYTINQKVRIGDRLQQENLQYNGENVLYNNEEVMVYTQ